MLLVYGINHHKTPIAIREKLSFDASELSAALTHFVKQTITNEVVILSTCNRTEIYTTIKNTGILEQWIIQQKSLTDIVLTDYVYIYEDREAIEHMMRVASGLDSMVLGEPQVLGQMKQAYFTAQEIGTIGESFNQLFPAIFSAAKCIRTVTDIGAQSVSMGSAIAQLIKNTIALENCSVLLVGAGELIELIATHLHGLHVQKIIVANRTLEKSQLLAERMQAETVHLQDIPMILNQVDVVITATASLLPILNKTVVEAAVAHRDKPLLLFDLAVPRDIAADVASLQQVQLFNIDDLQQMITTHKYNRTEAAIAAEKLITEQASFFLEKMRIFHARHIIARYRDRLEKLRDEAQQKALHQLQQGVDPQVVLDQFGRTLVNKIMHHPTIKLREAAAMEECDALRNMREFFEL